jgi:integration host factor subunit alpha
MPGVGKALTRVELYDAVYRRVGLSRSESSALVELVLKEISDGVARGEAVKLSSVPSTFARRVGGWVEIRRQALTYRYRLAAWSSSGLRPS